MPIWEYRSVSCSRQTLEKLLDNLKYISSTPNTSNEDQKLIKRAFNVCYDLVQDLDTFKSDMIKSISEMKTYMISSDDVKQFETRYKEFWEQR